MSGGAGSEQPASAVDTSAGGSSIDVDAPSGSDAMADTASGPVDAATAGVDTCSIASTLDVIGDRWTLLILRDAFRGIRRFEALQRDLGIARNLLADRLARLVEHGVLEKVRYQDRPPRSEYRLTPAGRDLSPVLVALMHWGDRHSVPQAGPPVELVHRGCEHPIEVRLVCTACDASLTATDLVGRPGPGSPTRPSDDRRGSR